MSPAYIPAWRTTYNHLMRKRIGKPSRYYRKRRFRVKRLARLVKRIAKRIPETKFVQQLINTTSLHNGMPDVTYYNLLSGNSQGVDRGDRIGNKISITSVQVDAFFSTTYHPVNVAQTTGVQAATIIQLWIVTNPRNVSVDDTTNYINSWAANVVAGTMPDPDYVKVLKMRRYVSSLTLTPFDPNAGGAGVSQQQLFWQSGTLNGNFKYSRKKKAMTVNFESAAETQPSDKQYFLILSTLGPNSLSGQTSYAGAFRYTYKDS